MSDPLMMPPKLDLSAVTDLHSKLMARQKQNVTLDMAEVSHIGALCLQLMIAAARQAQKAGTQFRLLNTNDRVVTQMRVMGTTPETIMEGQP